MSFLDLITNYLGATTILLLVAMKYYQETPCPAIVQRVEGGYDPLRQEVRASVNTAVKSLEVGDTIMFVVQELANFQAPAQSGQGNGGGAMPPVDPAVCSLYPTVKSQRCDDAGTANDPSDDRFWADILVEKYGPCRSSRWKTADGLNGRYQSTVTLGPYLIREGIRELRFADENDKTAMAKLTLYPPPPCSGNAVSTDACTIYAAAQNVNCDGQNTQNGSDDTYTFELLVTKNGPCGNNWTAVGSKSGRYGTSVPFGPYKISQGIQKITVADSQNPSLTTVVTVNPPAPCSRSNNDGAHWPQLPGVVNFYIKWGDLNQKVDLYVEKNGNWIWHERPFDRSIGRWDNFKSSPLDRTDVETLRQKEPKQGTYKIYGYYKGARKGVDKATVDVDFYALSSLRSAGNRKISVSVPMSDKSPRRGGGKLLATVIVSADGSIQVKE